VARKPSKPKSKNLEESLVAATEKFRGAMDPAEYKHIILGLVFLRYLSEAFELKQKVLEADKLSDPEDPEEYQADNIFWVPKVARWSHLSSQSRNASIGKKIDEAMRSIENENESLKGVLYKDYGKPNLDPKMLGGLVDMLTNLKLEGSTADFDFLGRIYEFFLAHYAGKEGKRGGDFYTPSSIVRTLVEMIEPLHGRVYDPCCGTGGFFVQSEKLIKAHQGKIGDIAIYGQERNNTTWKLAKMNLAIRGVEADIRWNPEGTLLNDAFPDMRFDFCLANPPFNVEEWGGELLKEDSRWKSGIPPEKNANFAWIQHILYHLKPNGRAGIVLANGSMTSTKDSEGEIRKALVEKGHVDCMVALPSQLFYGTQIPACLWILRKNDSNFKAKEETNDVLFIDARNLGKMISRKQLELTEEDIHKIADAYHDRRKGKNKYMDIPGFCKLVSLEEIRKSDFMLTPGRYVGTVLIEENEEEFASRMRTLVEQLQGYMSEAQQLSGRIHENLAGLGYV
jgi:type I restriction enzyme M protein